MDSRMIYNRASRLVRRCGTRDPVRIAEELGIRIYYEPELQDLLGMYTYAFRHRLMILNSHMDEKLRSLVVAHELGHDALHRDIAKNGCLQEFELFHIIDRTEYEANAFAAHILMDNEEIYSLARQGMDIVQIAGESGCGSVNMTLIMIQEMMHLGYDFRLPYEPDAEFFRRIRAGEAEGNMDPEQQP